MGSDSVELQVLATDIKVPWLLEEKCASVVSSPTTPLPPDSDAEDEDEVSRVLRNTLTVPSPLGYRVSC